MPADMIIWDDLPGQPESLLMQQWHRERCCLWWFAIQATRVLGTTPFQPTGDP